MVVFRKHIKLQMHRILRYQYKTDSWRLAFINCNLTVYIKRKMVSKLMLETKSVKSKIDFWEECFLIVN